MNLSINNKSVQVPDDSTIETMLASVVESVSGLAVAVNGKVIKREEWVGFHLNDGDNILLVKAAYGG